MIDKSSQRPNHQQVPPTINGWVFVDNSSRNGWIFPWNPRWNRWIRHGTWTTTGPPIQASVVPHPAPAAEALRPGEGRGGTTWRGRRKLWGSSLENVMYDDLCIIFFNVKSNGNMEKIGIRLVELKNRWGILTSKNSWDLVEWISPTWLELSAESFGGSGWIW